MISEEDLAEMCRGCQYNDYCKDFPDEYGLCREDRREE